MRLLITTCCVALAVALPTPYDNILDDEEPVAIVQKNMNDIMGDAYWPTYPEIAAGNDAEGDADLEAWISALEALLTDAGTQDEGASSNGSASSTYSSEKTESATSSYLINGDGGRVNATADIQKQIDTENLMHDLLEDVVESMNLNEDNETLAIEEDSTFISNDNYPTASSDVRGEDAASYSTSDGGVVISTSSTEATTTSSVPENSSNSSAAPDAYASSSSDTDDANASSDLAGEAAVSSSASGEATVGSDAPAQTIASSASSDESPVSVAAPDNVPASTGASDEVPALSASADEISTVSSAAHGETATSTSISDDVSVASIISGATVPSSPPAHEEAVSSSDLDELAPPQADSGEDIAVSSAPSGQDGASSGLPAESADASAASYDTSVSSGTLTKVPAPSSASDEAVLSSEEPANLPQLGETVFSSNATRTDELEKSESSQLPFGTIPDINDTGKADAEKGDHYFENLLQEFLEEVFTDQSRTDDDGNSEPAFNEASSTVSPIHASSVKPSDAHEEATFSTVAPDEVPATSETASESQFTSSTTSNKAMDTTPISTATTISSVSTIEVTERYPTSYDLSATADEAGEIPGAFKDATVSPSPTGDVFNLSPASGDAVSSSVASAGVTSPHAAPGEAVYSSVTSPSVLPGVPGNTDVLSSAIEASTSTAIPDKVEEVFAALDDTGFSSAAGDGASLSPTIFPSVSGEPDAPAAVSSDTASSSTAYGESSISPAEMNNTSSFSAHGEDTISSANLDGNISTSFASDEAGASAAVSEEEVVAATGFNDASTMLNAANDAAVSPLAPVKTVALSSTSGDAPSSAVSGGSSWLSAVSEEDATSSADPVATANTTTTSESSSAWDDASKEDLVPSSTSHEGAGSSVVSGEDAATPNPSAINHNSSNASDVAPGSSPASTSKQNWDDYDEDTVNGTCVPYYLCKDNDIITDGAGLIDIRFSLGDDEESKSNSQCPNFLDVLCGAPLAEPDPEIMEELVNYEYVPSCGHRNPKGVGAIMDGFKEGESQFGEFPWMAIILEDEVMDFDQVIQRYVCGGSLIHKQVIMTAAHCVKGKDVSSLQVRLGEWDTENEKEIFLHEQHRVASIVLHERFHSRNLRYDVALLFLEEPVELKQHIDTLCLPEEDENFDYSSCVATGFGKDHFHGGRFQNIMKQVDLSIVPHRACQRKLQSTRLGPWFRLHPSFTCAGGEEGVDTCRGDGGGPLACPSKGNPDKYVQVGIVAWGIGCGEDGVPGVYASVPKLIGWVNGQMAQYFGSERPGQPL